MHINYSFIYFFILTYILTAFGHEIKKIDKNDNSFEINSFDSVNFSIYSSNWDSIKKEILNCLVSLSLPLN